MPILMRTRKLRNHKRVKGEGGGKQKGQSTEKTHPIESKKGDNGSTIRIKEAKDTFFLKIEDAVEEADNAVKEIDVTIRKRMLDLEGNKEIEVIDGRELQQVPSGEAGEPPREPPGPPLAVLRLPSVGPLLRSYNGTTSCRHFLILIIVTDVADEYYVIIYHTENADKSLKRSLISKIWRQTIERSDPGDYHDLKQFFSHNDPTRVDRVEIHNIVGLTATGNVILINPHIIPEGLRLYRVVEPVSVPIGSFDFTRNAQIYPMAITNSDGTHIFHYFSIILEGGSVYIYSAYGSDYLRAHPERVLTSFQEIDLFIKAGIALQATPRNPNAMPRLNHFFVKFFTQNADETVSYLDESYSRARYITINKKRGIELEIEYYVNGYRMVYFPTVKEGLRAACRRELVRITSEGRLDDWSLPMRGGNKKRSNRRIARRKITRRKLRRYSRPKN